MDTGNGGLLRDWAFVQDVVMTELLKAQDDRRPVVWTIGSAADALALSMAWKDRSPDRSPATVFLSPSAPAELRAEFTAGDLRGLPDPVKGRFQLRNRRWVAPTAAASSVHLAAPPGMVDLLAVRSNGHSDAVEPAVAAALPRVRAGGFLLWADHAPRAFDDTDFVECHESRRFFVASRAGRLCVARPRPPSEEPTLGDREQHRDLVESHIGLARSVARRYAQRGESPDDLEQVAMLALVKASRRYDSNRQAAFSTFATAYIMGELKRYFRDKTWTLRVSRSLQETYLAIKGARDELTQRLSSQPTVDQIAAHLGLSSEQVLEAMEAGSSYWPTSLNVSNRDEDSGIDIPVTDPGFDRSLDTQQLQQYLPELDDRAQWVIRRLYFDRATQREIAGELGVSQMQVSRIHAGALSALRNVFVEPLAAGA